MLTQEQIKNLKEGDKLTLTAFFECEQDGYVRFRLEPLPYLDSLTICASRDLFSLPSDSDRTFCHVVDNMVKPKYSPTRLLKKGDKVRVVEWNGRHFHDRDHGTELTTGCICEVVDDEEATSEYGVLVVYEEQVRGIAPCFLELVTPVEELEQFYVDYITTDDDDDLDDNPRWCVKYRKYDDIVRVFYRNALEHPKKTRAAAEAECARLNEEWRKEHAND